MWLTLRGCVFRLFFVSAFREGSKDSEREGARDLQREEGKLIQPEELKSKAD